MENISRWEKTHQIDIWVEVFESEEEWAQLKFKDARHPNSIRLYIPAVTIEGDVVSVPIMTGNYVEKIRFSFGW